MMGNSRKISNRRESAPVAWMKILVAVALVTPPAWAEDPVGINGSTLVNGGENGGSSKEGLVAEGLSKNLVNTNLINDNSANNATNGREYKAGDAKRQGNAGMAAAIATGSGLVATAIPMLASIDPIVRAAGADLMGKAGLSFAQAAATAGTRNKNSDQKQRLTEDDGQKGKQGAASGPSGSDVQSQVAQQLGENQQLNQLLARQGVNPEDFINRLAGGELTTPEAVIAASGSAPVSSEDLAAAAASGYAGGPEKLGQPLNPRIATDDAAGVALRPDQIPGGRGGAGSAKDEKATASFEPVGRVPAGEAKSVDDLRGAVAAANGLQSGWLDPASLLALMGAKGSAQGLSALALQHLVSLGILKTNPKQTIFQLAHRNYRSFEKWRRSRKTSPAAIAARPGSAHSVTPAVAGEHKRVVAERQAKRPPRARSGRAMKQGASLRRSQSNRFARNP